MTLTVWTGSSDCAHWYGAPPCSNCEGRQRYGCWFPDPDTGYYFVYCGSCGAEL